MWSPTQWRSTCSHSKVASASRSIGTPSSPSVNSAEQPSNLFSLGLQKCCDMATWRACRMLMQKWVARSKVGRLPASLRRLHSTMGGSSDTEQNELAVRPSSLPSGPRVVMTQTPVANLPSALRRSRRSGCGTGVSHTPGGRKPAMRVAGIILLSVVACVALEGPTAAHQFLLIMQLYFQCRANRKKFHCLIFKGLPCLREFRMAMNNPL